MGSTTAIQRLRVQNLLSFGDDGLDLELAPLNVLIGPNGCGKSNLISVFRLLASTPDSLGEFLRSAGSIRDWLYKGRDKKRKRSIADVVEYGNSALIDVFLAYPSGKLPLRYALLLGTDGERFSVFEEHIQDETEDGQFKSAGTATSPTGQWHGNYFGYIGGSPILAAEGERSRSMERLNPDESVLSQIRDPELYPQLSHVARAFGAISFYEGWQISRESPIREPQSTELPMGRLAESGKNLALILNKWMSKPSFESEFLEYLRDFSGDVRKISFDINAGRIRLLLNEKHFDDPIPASRISDGTLNWIYLLALLLDPSPPPVICIEEPELGLHPDIIPKLAGLLVDASARTQIIVTTHSDVLVDALTDTPDAVIVCEKEKGSTTLQRLDPERLKSWLEKYTLGQLWTSGEIGGNRW